MSDLTDEVSMCADDNAPECDINVPCPEIATIAGVSEIPLLHVQELDQAPSALSRDCSDSVIPKPHPKAVVSLEPPYKFLIVSKDFCSLFGFSVEDEICGNSVTILQGSRTDPSILVSGIKGAALSSTSRSRIVLYDCNGTDIELDIAFSPLLSGDESLLAGCQLELSLVTGGS